MGPRHKAGPIPRSHKGTTIWGSAQEASSADNRRNNDPLVLKIHAEEISVNLLAAIGITAFLALVIRALSRYRPI